eukprot:672186-Pyramimonas_sp.AAC.1
MHWGLSWGIYNYTDKLFTTRVPSMHVTSGVKALRAGPDAETTRSQRPRRPNPGQGRGRLEPR